MNVSRIHEGTLTGRNPLRVQVAGKKRGVSLDDRLKKRCIVLYPGRQVQCIRIKAHFRIVGVQVTAKVLSGLLFPKNMRAAAHKAMRTTGDALWYPQTTIVDWLEPTVWEFFRGLGYPPVRADLSQYGTWEPKNDTSIFWKPQLLVLDEVWVAIWHEGPRTKYFAATPERFEYDVLDEHEDEWEGAHIIRTVCYYCALKKTYGAEPEREVEELVEPAPSASFRGRNKLVGAVKVLV